MGLPLSPQLQFLAKSMHYIIEGTKLGCQLTFAPDDGLLVDEILVFFDGATLAATGYTPLNVRLASQIHLHACTHSHHKTACNNF